jgi:hypothetical protein
VGIIGAIGRKLGVPSKIWNGVESRLATVETDEDGFITAFVHSGQEPGRGGTRWMRRWERGRGVAWQRRGEGLRYLLPVFGSLIVFRDGEQMVAVEKQSGEEKWRHNLTMRMGEEPQVADGLLVLVGDKGDWLKVDPTSGAVQSSGTFGSTSEKNALLAATRPAVDDRKYSTKVFPEDALVKSWYPEGTDAWEAVRKFCETLYPRWSAFQSELKIIKADPVTRTLTVMVASEETYGRRHALVAVLDPVGQKQLWKRDVGLYYQRSESQILSTFVQRFDRILAVGLYNLDTPAGHDSHVASLVDLAQGRLLGQLSPDIDSWIALPDGGREKVVA